MEIHWNMQEADKLLILTLYTQVSLWIPSWSRTWKRAEARVCGQSKWLVLCSGCTKTSKGNVYNWGKGNSMFPFYFLLYNWSSSVSLSFPFYITNRAHNFFLLYWGLFSFLERLTQKEWMSISQVACQPFSGKVACLNYIYDGFAKLCSEKRPCWEK